MIVTVHSNAKDLPRRPNKKIYKQLDYKTIIERKLIYHIIYKKKAEVLHITINIKLL